MTGSLSQWITVVVALATAGCLLPDEAGSGDTSNGTEAPPLPPANGTEPLVLATNRGEYYDWACRFTSSRDYYGEERLLGSDENLSAETKNKTVFVQRGDDDWIRYEYKSRYPIIRAWFTPVGELNGTVQLVDGTWNITNVSAREVTLEARVRFNQVAESWFEAFLDTGGAPLPCPASKIYAVRPD